VVGEYYDLIKKPGTKGKFIKKGHKVNIRGQYPQFYEYFKGINACYPIIGIIFD